MVGSSAWCNSTCCRAIPEAAPLLIRWKQIGIENRILGGAMRATFAAALAAFFLSTAGALACGQERWPVKTGTDDDVRSVILAPRLTTIAALHAIPAPADPNAQRSSRFAPVETSVATLSAILTVIKRETDEDYHLVLADPANPRLTMIVESPHPHCALGSLFAENIAATRGAIEDFFGGPIQGRHVVNEPVTVTGIPFFDPLHGQEGVAPNGIELHPILAIRFDQP